MSAIPVIDMSSADKEALHQEWDAAFSTTGCCVLIGHGVEDFAALREEVHLFFAAPREVKMQYHFGPYGNEEGGYTPRSGEAVSQSNNMLPGDEQSGDDSTEKPVLSDPVESFVLNPQNHQHYTSILPLACEHYRKCEDLVHRLHALSTRALGVPEHIDADYFRKYYCASDAEARGTASPSFALRLAHYPPQDDEDRPAHENGEGSDVRYGAHTDYMGFTVLLPDDSDWSTVLDGCGGLEVYNSADKCWIPVIIPDNIKSTALVVNAGDLLQRWTNDRWLSPLHRVSGPRRRSPAALRSRTSLVFFSGPMEDALISVCPHCLDQRGGEGESRAAAKYEPVVAKDYLMSKINPTALDISSATTSI